MVQATRRDLREPFGAGTLPRGRAADRLFSVLYDELKKRAARYLTKERPGHTLQPTALVHEAYLLLAREKEIPWQSRAHFLAIAARAMREVLVHHAQRRHRLKRGASRRRVPLDKVTVVFEERAFDLVALDDALKRLVELDERKSKVVELRFFGGLTIDETAHVLAVSHATVEREWKFSRAWLRRELGNGSGHDA